MTTAKIKRSDVFGHTSDDDASASPPPAPLLQRDVNMKKDRDPPSDGQMHYGVAWAGMSASSARVPGVFTRTGPVRVQQQHYSGPVDSDGEFFRSLMNGTKRTSPTRRPSVEVDGAHTLRVQNRQYYTQGARADVTSAAHGAGHNTVTFQPASIDTTSNTVNVKTEGGNDLSRDESVERRTRLKSILLSKQRRDNPTSETATHVTRGSSTASFFGNAKSKLKGYLSTYKHKRASQSSASDYQLDPQGGSYISGTRNPKYRQDVPQDANRNAGYNRSNEPEFVRQFHNRQMKFSGGQSVTSRDGDAISHTNTIKTKYHDEASTSSKNSRNSKKLKKKSSSKRLSETNALDNKFRVQVFDLPWSDSRPGSHIRGRYSGPVDNSMLPHGKGTVVLHGNKSLKCHGVFEHGSLASDLICRSEDDVIDADDIGQLPAAPFSDTPRRAPKEPAGVVLDDVPLNLPSQNPQQHRPVHQTDKKWVEKQNQKRRVNSRTPERRSTVESFPPNDIQQFFNARKSHPRGNDTPISDDPQTAAPARQKYNLGDIARTPRDMIIHTSNNEAIHSASLLKKYEKAFLKRSNGLWTAAILADRSLQPTKTKQRASAHWYTEWEIDPTTMELEDSMLFVINGDGATKIVARRHWGKFVRRMNVHDMEEIIEEETDGKESSAAGTDEA